MKVGRMVGAAACLAGMVLLLQGSGSYAAEEAKPKESCVTAACHPKMGKEPFVHGPVATGDCLACHRQIGKHRFEKMKDIGKLCDECHEKMDKQKVVHPPVKEGKCTMCHDPHQSANKFQLKAAGSALCFTCHDKSAFNMKFMHGPAAVGSCDSCHSVHQSNFKKLLTAEGNELCFSCHTDKADMIKSKKFVHSAVQDACVNCHGPHGGNFQYNLKAEGTRDLCFTCHTEKQKEVQEAAVKHKGLETDRKCLACHDVHASDYTKQLAKQPAELCLSCHNRKYTSDSGTTMDMKAMLAANPQKHGPILQNDCSGCHNAHGSANFRLLRENFPQVFYAGYNPDNYKLCFMCHEKNIAADELTSTMTGFRNGDKNLHYVHVNKVTKGRTCRACHDPHATRNPKHVRDAVPFARWQLPIGFQKTETGGQCLPGCHQLFKYDRNTAVVNKPSTTSQAATR